MLRVGIVGGGLVGTLAAIGFAKRGWRVDLYESREDPRDEAADSAAREQDPRSYNIGMGSRGSHALAVIDPELLEQVVAQSTPMRGRAIHVPRIKGGGYRVYVDTFGGDGSAVVHMLNRSTLWVTMLHRAAKVGVHLHFGRRLRFMTLRSDPPRATFERVGSGDCESAVADFWLGADGVNSAFRGQLALVVPMCVSQQFIPVDYINFHLSCTDSVGLSRELLHLWPSSMFTAIATPNPSTGGFTAGITVPTKLRGKLESDDEILRVMETTAPDLLRLAGPETAIKAFREHPRTRLGTVKCSPIYYNEKALLIGDAAHAMTPFYGQGMNAGFEDVRLLLEALDRQPDGAVNAAMLRELGEQRPIDTDAVADLSLRNWRYVTNPILRPWFILRGYVDKNLHGLLGGSLWQFAPKSIIFEHWRRYSEVRCREQLQEWLARGVLALGAFGAAAVTARLLGKRRRNS